MAIATRAALEMRLKKLKLRAFAPIHSNKKSDGTPITIRLSQPTMDFGNAGKYVTAA